MKTFFNFTLVVGLLLVSYIAPAPVRAAQLAEIEKRGELIVAVKDNLRPLAFQDANGNLQGFEIDVARRLAAELLGNPDAVVLQPVTNRDRLDVVIQDKVDLTIARVTVTDSRSRLVEFSIPYYLDGTGLVTKNASINKLSDLSTGTIAVIKGSSTIAVVKYALPGATLVGVDSYQEARSLLEAGRADAFAADRSVLTGWVQEYPEYQQLAVWLSGEALGVVMPKGLEYVELRQKVNEAIARWRAEGWLAQRAAAWGLP
ncbi:MULTISPECIES: transporter substrate-binding domain-containing protein [unclassified Coleofasciculus]|uniref:transporter substrate-binding domain-containing protein n=1 Tax=unclassified Coleofasciculus TaxID=2692782 RepID=UPI0018822E9B|nr:MULTISPECIES: transporter substrate-binding domain-containing protein [unclassified Coleofasciculus]MBE9126996.1 transporter substrate-binding domain-containing protein [Coleofasciculus sp. LEGE 07081]MBE9149103.1 transporter substrate-binding domain-containing protein [Coleofasciculus sp. LEGE 07092]